MAPKALSLVRLALAPWPTRRATAWVIEDHRSYEIFVERVLTGARPWVIAYYL